MSTWSNITYDVFDISERGNDKIRGDKGTTNDLMLLIVFLVS